MRALDSRLEISQIDVRTAARQLDVRHEALFVVNTKGTVVDEPMKENVRFERIVRHAQTRGERPESVEVRLACRRILTSTRVRGQPQLG